tara:strand:+ start:42 stop:569 length:528 start_codon:yes stop_codon:yes gene_type:complete
MITIFGEEEFRPITKYGIKIPDYFISKDGRCCSTKTSKHKLLNPVYRRVEEGYKVPPKLSCQVDKSKNPELFVDYDYSSYNYKYKGKVTSSFNRNVVIISVKIHRAVMEAWKPIDENPPDSLKDDWDNAPESFKQWVRDSAIIDHIDSDTSNNNIDNLRWVNSRENEFNRKKQKG